MERGNERGGIPMQVKPQKLGVPTVQKAEIKIKKKKKDHLSASGIMDPPTIQLCKNVCIIIVIYK